MKIKIIFERPTGAEKAVIEEEYDTENCGEGYLSNDLKAAIGDKWIKFMKEDSKLDRYDSFYGLSKINVYSEDEDSKGERIFIEHKYCRCEAEDLENNRNLIGLYECLLNKLLGAIYEKWPPK